jgi:hypothetical protein
LEDTTLTPGPTSSPETPPHPDRRPRHLALILIGLVILRWWLATTPGYPADLHAYKVWALQAGLSGVQTVYDDRHSLYDYPPLYAYLLAPVGRLYGWMAPAAVREFPHTRLFGDSATLSILVKLPPLVFDILIALLIAHLAYRQRLWLRRTWCGWLPALLYLCLPPALIDSGYWGQPDVIHTFWIMLGLTLILAGRIELGWACAALACLMKPLAIPYLPLLALAALIRAGWWRTLRGGLVFLGTLVAGFLPFLLTGRAETAIRRVFLDVGLMPFTSVNGHNLWWLARAWYPADYPLIGPISYANAGMFLFGIAYAFILWTVWRLETGRVRAAGTGRFAIARGAEPLATQMHWYFAAAAVAYSFFTFSTHMHENHSFAVLPFLILLAGRGRRWMIYLWVAAFSIAVNMVTHDIILARDLWSHVGGVSHYYHPDMFRNLSYLELLMAHGNAILTLVLCGILLVGFERFRRSATTPPSSAH